MFRGASDVQIMNGATFNTIVDGVVVESYTHGPGRFDNLQFGMQFSPGQSSTMHQDRSQRSRSDVPSSSSDEDDFEW
jgi:hypothetical protein